MPWIPGLVFTIVSIVTGLMALLLPETLDRPLPETIEEIETWQRTITPEEKEAIRKTQEAYRIRLQNMKPDDGEVNV